MQIELTHQRFSVKLTRIFEPDDTTLLLAIVANVRGPVACGELFGRGSGFQRQQAVLNSALAVSMSLAVPMGKPRGMLTVTFHSQMPGVRSEAKRMRPMRCRPSSTR